MSGREVTGSDPRSQSIHGPPERAGPDPLRLLTRNEVQQIYGISKRWLELAAVQGTGPPIVRISPRMVRYRSRDVEAWIDGKVESPENTAAGRRLR